MLTGIPPVGGKSFFTFINSDWERIMDDNTFFIIKSNLFVVKVEVDFVAVYVVSVPAHSEIPLKKIEKNVLETGRGLLMC
jgi:hypothetical protein